MAEEPVGACMWRGLVVAALLVLAGCSGFTGTATETLTPVPVPAESASPTPTPEPYAAASGSDAPAPFALAEAHASVLANRSFTVDRSLVVRDGNDTLRTVNRTVRVGAGGRPYHAVETATSDEAYPVSSVAARVEIWFAGPPALFRIGTRNVTYRVATTPRLGGPLGDSTAHDRLVALSGGFQDWDATCTADGCRLRGRAPSDTAVLNVPLLLSNVSNATLTVWLAPDQHVRRYRLTYAAELDGRGVRVVRAVRFTALGETTVRRPAWVDEARTNTSAPVSGGTGWPL